MLEKPHDNGAATGLELRRPGGDEPNPHEVLGNLNRTNLTANVGMAAVATLALLAVLTFGQAVLQRASAGKKPAAVEDAGQAAKVEPVAKETPKTATKTEPDILDRTKGPADPFAVKPPAGKDPLEKLGVSETKTTDPKKNPLDRGVDDLLKDIK